jgi:hypothetical protein
MGHLTCGKRRRKQGTQGRGRPIAQAPADPPSPEPCDPRADLRYGGALDTTLTFGSFALSGGVTADGTAGASRLEQLGLSGRAALSRILDDGRASLALFASQGTFFSMVSARAEIGALLLHEKLDVSVHWRPALVRYEANLDRFVEQQIGGDVRVWLGAETDLEVSLAVDALWGDAGDALLVQTQIGWRPSF